MRAWAALRDADPVVRHRDLHRLARRAHRDADLAAVRAELDRVVEQVDEDLAEPFRVTADRRQPAGDVHAQRRRPGGRRTGRRRSVDVGRELGQVDVVE